MAKIVVKGLVCDSKFTLVRKPINIEGVDEFTKTITKLNEDCDSFLLVDSNSSYELVEQRFVKEEREMKVIHDLPYKPSMGEYIGVDGEEYPILRVTNWEDGTVVCIIANVIEDTVLGDSMESLKAIMDKGIDVGCKSSKPKKKDGILTMFRGKDEGHKC